MDARRRRGAPGWDIFVSYAHKDGKKVAEKLEEGLERRGLRVWRDDTGLMVGDKVSAAIMDAMERSAYVVAVVSPEYVKGNYTMIEVGGMLRGEHKNRILPVLYKTSHAEVASKLPMLSDTFMVDWSDGDPEPLLDKIARAVEGLGRGRGRTARPGGARTGSSRGGRTGTARKSGPRDAPRWDVFLSYVRRDGWRVAERIEEGLEQRGLSVWRYDARLSVGDDVSAGIEEALADSAYVVAVVSPMYARRPPRAVRVPGGEPGGPRMGILPVLHRTRPSYVAYRIPALAGAFMRRWDVRYSDSLLDELARIAGGGEEGHGGEPGRLD